VLETSLGVDESLTGNCDDCFKTFSNSFNVYRGCALLKEQIESWKN